jgi:hypothetical protein
MKKYLPVYLLLTATAVTTLRCHHDDDNPSKETPACMPTTLPGYGASLAIAYNKDHKIADVQYAAYPSGAVTNYKELYAYFNGRLSRITIRRNDNVETYKTFTYEARTITERHYHIANTSQNEVITYYLAPNGKQILARARYVAGVRDSAVFTYTGHNITRMDAYDTNDALKYYYRYEYDNKTNPFALAGLSGEDEEYFKPVNISRNNITRIKFYADNTGHTDFTYTYDDNNRPITRTIVSDAGNNPAQEIAYLCE